MTGLFYMNFSGFTVIVIDDLQDRYSVEEVKKQSITDWKYIIITRKVVTFPIVFKNILEYAKSGEHYVKIFFYEQRDKPIEVRIFVLNPRTVVLVSGRPSLENILRKMISNPRYGETVVFIAKLVSDLENNISKYNDLMKVSKKLFLELTPIVYGQGIGRFSALRIVERRGSFDVTICVSRKGVDLRTDYGDIKVDIKGIDLCIK